MFLPTVKESILVRCLIQEKAIHRLSFSPVLLGDDGRPVMLMEGDRRLEDIFETMRKLSERLNAKLDFLGNEALIGE